MAADNPSHVIQTKFGMVCGIEDVNKRAKFGVDRLRGVGCVG